MPSISNHLGPAVILCNGPRSVPQSTEMKHQNAIPLSISGDIECDLIVGGNPNELPSSTLYDDIKPGYSIIFSLCVSGDIFNDIALLLLFIDHGDSSVFAHRLIAIGSVSNLQRMPHDQPIPPPFRSFHVAAILCNGYIHIVWLIQGLWYCRLYLGHLYCVLFLQL